MNLNRIKNLTKKQIIAGIINVSLVVLGSFVLAFGNAAFLIPFDLITGGLSSIGIIIQYFLDANGVDFQIVDIVIWTITILKKIWTILSRGRKRLA